MWTQVDDNAFLLYCLEEEVDIDELVNKIIKGFSDE